MRIPKQKHDRHAIAEHELTPMGIQGLLDQGAVLSGPGSDTEDSYLFREGSLYVYALDPQFGKNEQQFMTCAATREGLAELLCMACFHGSSWSLRQ